MWQNGCPLWASPPQRVQTVWSGALTLLPGNTSFSHKDCVLMELGPALALHYS